LVNTWQRPRRLTVIGGYGGMSEKVKPRPAQMVVISADVHARDDTSPGPKVHQDLNNHPTSVRAPLALTEKHFAIDAILNPLFVPRSLQYAILTTDGKGLPAAGPCLSRFPGCPVRRVMLAAGNRGLAAPPWRLAVRLRNDCL
jgi:hypothetical protein